MLRAGPKCPAVKAEYAGLTGFEPASAIPPNGASAAVIFPAQYPVFKVLPNGMQAARPATPKQKRPRLHPSRWPEIAERARYESLRDLAAAYSVSHETIRAILGRMAKRNAVAA
jgi:hypothetical protein